MRKQWKTTDPNQFQPYECKKHGLVKPRLTLRKSGYWHRRCPECLKAFTGPYMQRYMPGWMRRKRRSVRNEVLTAYGGKCACCSESNYGFLSIDHVNNDGKKHREELKNVGSAIYAWLKKHGMPKDGFRLLCYSCNLGRAFNGGTCPHLDPPMGAAPVFSGSG